MPSSLAASTVLNAPPAVAALEERRGRPLPLEACSLLVASNRGPVQYRLRDQRMEAAPTAGGLVSALAGLAESLPLTWIASPSGPADRLVARRASLLPPARGSTRLRFVDASEEALDWSYRRFSNPVLWFLQHGLWDQVRPRGLQTLIERGWNLGYRPVNEAFARMLASELHQRPGQLVQVHDYHLYLVPRLLRQQASAALIQHFVHIPWPGPEAWQPLPPELRRALWHGLLGADLIGFQTPASAHNFLLGCQRFLPQAEVDLPRREVQLAGQRTRVRSYPISVDPPALRRLAAAAETRYHRERLRPLCGELTIVRVDRLDPSKNIPLGFQAFGLLLERRPELVGRVRFLAFLVPSRGNVAEYRRHAQEVWRAVEAVNGRFGRPGWTPIEVLCEDNRSQALAGLSLADVLLVNAVADGMNLVAKEGVIVGERDPVLVLSEGCGAHTQLGAAALSIPPRDLVATANALERALAMPLRERRFRASLLRAAIEAQDLSWWLDQQLTDLVDSRRE